MVSPPPTLLQDPWQAARRVLCVRLDTLGDVVMSIPAIRAVKSSAGRQVTLLTSSIGAEVAPLIAEVDDAMVYDAPWMKATNSGCGSAADHAVIRRLERGHFDAAVIFTAVGQDALPAALLCHLADIPLRLAHAHEKPYQLLTQWVPDPEHAIASRHEVRRQLDLVAAVGYATDDERLRLNVDSGSRQEVRELRQSLGLAGQTWAIVHPGARAPSRRYPPELYAEVARVLTERLGWQLIFTGSAEEAELIERIRAGLHRMTISLAGRLTLPQLVALIDSAPVVIANNTGPAHIAAATGTPIVDLYALTNPQHTPWGAVSRVLSHDVPCRGCLRSVCPHGHQACLAHIPPHEVVSAAVELMERAEGQSSLDVIRARAQSACPAIVEPPFFF